MIKIYGLVCPFSGDIRYIGKTDRKLKVRLKAHLSESLRLRSSHKHRWIASCCQAGEPPRMWLLEEVEEGVRWQDRERAWIQRAIEIGLDLTNQTAGGEGLDFIDPEIKAAYALTMSRKMKAVNADRPEIRERRGQITKASWANNREFRLAALAAGIQTEEAKQNLAKAMAEVRSRPGYKEERSRNAKRIWDTSRDKIMEAFATPEVKAKHSARAKRCWNDPEIRGRMMNRWTQEKREQMSRMATARATPEYREMMREKTRQRWANTPQEKKDAMMASVRAKKVNK